MKIIGQCLCNDKRTMNIYPHYNNAKRIKIIYLSFSKAIPEILLQYTNVSYLVIAY